MGSPNSVETRMSDGTRMRVFRPHRHEDGTLWVGMISYRTTPAHTRLVQTKPLTLTDGPEWDTITTPPSTSECHFEEPLGYFKRRLREADNAG